MNDIKAQDKVSIGDRLGTVTYRTGKKSHLRILDPKVCLGCKGKPCTTICPAQVYTWSEEKQEIILSWENCFEMAACISACPYCNIEFLYPKGGSGVEFRYG